MLAGPFTPKWTSDCGNGRFRLWNHDHSLKHRKSTVEEFMRTWNNTEGPKSSSNLFILMSLRALWVPYDHLTRNIVDDAGTLRTRVRWTCTRMCKISQVLESLVKPTAGLPNVFNGIVVNAAICPSQCVGSRSMSISTVSFALFESSTAKSQNFERFSLSISVLS